MQDKNGSNDNNGDKDDNCKIKKLKIKKKEVTANILYYHYSMFWTIKHKVLKLEM